MLAPRWRTCLSLRWVCHCCFTANRNLHACVGVLLRTVCLKLTFLFLRCLCLGFASFLFLGFAAQTDAQRKKRTFKKFSFRGKDLEGLLQLSPEETMDLLCSRARRKFRRGTSAAEVRYMKKLRKAKAGE